MLSKGQCCFSYRQVSSHNEPAASKGAQRTRTVPISSAQAGMAAIGHLHQYAADQLVTSLARAQKSKQTVADTGGLTLMQADALAQLNHAFCETLLTFIGEAGVCIIDDLEHRQRLHSVEIAIQQQLEQLVQQYFQYVQTILRR